MSLVLNNRAQVFCYICKAYHSYLLVFISLLIRGLLLWGKLLSDQFFFLQERSTLNIYHIGALFSYYHIFFFAIMAINSEGVNRLWHLTITTLYRQNNSDKIPQ